MFSQLIIAVLAIGATAELASAQTATRDKFLKMIDRPRVSLNPEVSKLSEAGGKASWHFTFAAEAGQRVPGILVKKASPAGRRPAVIVLSGTGGTKEDMAEYLEVLADRGFVGVSIDGRYHGERSKLGFGSDEYVDAMLRTYRTGKELPFLYDTVWDLMRLIDYLNTREDIDPARIGMIGFSKGGMETYLTAAVDPRVAVAVPMIGVQSFRWAIENDSWHSRVGTFQAAINAAAKDAGAQVNADFVRKFYDQVVPGIYSDFDGPEMVPLIAPRPLLSIHGDSDPRTPRPGVELAAARAMEAYGKAGAKDKFRLLWQENTGHMVRPAYLQQGFDWLSTWLNP